MVRGSSYHSPFKEPRIAWSEFPHSKKHVSPQALKSLRTNEIGMPIMQMIMFI